MMLEKIKRARASGFARVPVELQQHLDANEEAIASRYSEDELARLRRNGFTGLPIEQRAAMTGHVDAYNIAYRNFSRNIHSTDYLESYLKIGAYKIAGKDSYRESRDVAAHYTAHFSAVGMVESSRTMCLGSVLMAKINVLGDRQRAVKEILPLGFEAGAARTPRT